MYARKIQEDSKTENFKHLGELIHHNGLDKETDKGKARKILVDKIT